MIVRPRVAVALIVAVFGIGFALGGFLQPSVFAQSGTRVYELRTYTAPEGKLKELDARFRDHTLKLFENHGMTNVGYFHPQDAPNSQNTLIYLLAHKNRDEAKKSWAAFGADPEWVKVRTASEANGRLTTQVVSVFLDPLDFSAMK
jgi:NIPSNAP